MAMPFAGLMAGHALCRSHGRLSAGCGGLHNTALLVVQIKTLGTRLALSQKGGWVSDIKRLRRNGKNAANSDPDRRRVKRCASERYVVVYGTVGFGCVTGRVELLEFRRLR
jgi:hypothetical protein